MRASTRWLEHLLPVLLLGLASPLGVAVAGSTLFVPAGTPVGMVNKGPQLAKAWIVFASPHMAQYIRSLGSRSG